MSDILVRICVGACGLTVIAGGIRLLPTGSAGTGMAMLFIGLITILRALGVL